MWFWMGWDRMDGMDGMRCGRGGCVVWCNVGECEYEWREVDG